MRGNHLLPIEPLLRGKAAVSFEVVFLRFLLAMSVIGNIVQAMK